MRFSGDKKKDLFFEKLKKRIYIWNGDEIIPD